MKYNKTERLERKRERNKIHAKKTRERKKVLTNILQSRILDLKKEGNELRQKVDEIYAANTLINLSSAMTNLQSDGSGKNNSNMDLSNTKLSASICNNCYSDVVVQNGWLGESKPLEMISLDKKSADFNANSKRSRRNGKYTVAERDSIRRERNRIHAKKTREKNKNFFGMSEIIISEMKKESTALRSYLSSLYVLSQEEIEERQRQDLLFDEQLTRIKIECGGIAAKMTVKKASEEFYEHCQDSYSPNCTDNEYSDENGGQMIEELDDGSSVTVSFASCDGIEAKRESKMSTPNSSFNDYTDRSV